MSGAIAAAHHPSIFASVRPATKTAFLLIKDSPPFFFRLFFSYRNDDDTGQLIERLRNPRILPTTKSAKIRKTRKTQAQRLFLD